MTEDTPLVSLQLLGDGRIRIDTHGGTLTTSESNLLELFKNKFIEAYTEDKEVKIQSGLYLPFGIGGDLDDGHEFIRSTEQCEEVSYSDFLEALGELVTFALTLTEDEKPSGLEVARKD